jgi:eukaryotic-like serine/threonine-protein kinase
MERDDPQERPAPIRPGAVAGRYVVLMRIGEGGMGAVYSAYDPELDRRVALKFLRARLSGAASTEWRARLTREAQAMARLSHPNVVGVFDVGVTDDGQVFLAMEFVEGGSLTRWLASEPRTWREVLAVFLQAGAGLAAAHQAGIVHCDFKPDNVLVGTDGRARVTDFGIARAADATEVTQSATPTKAATPARSPSTRAAAFDSPLTLPGGQLGTPGYMAPEQYEGLRSDARTDVFSFCASLWQSLYGQLPFGGATPAEIEWSTRRGELQPPAKTGARLRVPARVQRILSRGLQASPDARFPTMQGLLAELRADPAARLRRWAWALGAVVAVFAALGIVEVRGAARETACRGARHGLDGVWDEARRAKVEAAFRGTGAPYAGDAWVAVRQALDAYADGWGAMSVEACEKTTVRGEQSPQMLELRSACLADRLDELRGIAEVFSTADAKTVAESAHAARALTPLDECADVDALAATTRRPADPAARATIRALDGKVAGCDALASSGNRTAAMTCLRSLHVAVEDVRYGPLLQRWTAATAHAESNTDPKAAVGDYETAVVLAEEHHMDRAQVAAQVHLGRLEGTELGKGDAGHLWLRLARATLAHLGRDPELEANADLEDGWIYLREQELQRAGDLFDRALDDGRQTMDPFDRASAYSGRAMVWSARGKQTDAVEQSQLALQTVSRAYGPDHPFLVGYLNNLAMAQLAAGDGVAGLASASRAVAISAASTTNPDPSGHAVALQTEGEILLRLHRPEEAEAKLSAARELYRRAYGEMSSDVAYAANELAEALRLQRRADEAERALDEAATIEVSGVDVAADVRAGTLDARARLRLDAGKSDEAEALAQRALTLLGPGGDARSRAEAYMTLARALRLRDPSRAAAAAQDALREFEKLRDADGREEALALLGAAPK